MKSLEGFNPESFRDRPISELFYVTPPGGKPRKQFYAKIQQKLLAAEEQAKESGETGLLHVFATKINSGSSIKRLVREHGIPEKIVTRVLDVAGIPHLDHAAAVAQIWADPDYRARQAISAGNNLKTMWDDPEFRRKRTEESGERMQAQWQDSGFRQRSVERGREIMTGLKQDPEFQAIPNPKQTG